MTAIFTALTLAIALSVAAEPAPRQVVFRHAGCDVSTGAYIAMMRGTFP